MKRLLFPLTLLILLSVACSNSVATPAAPQAPEQSLPAGSTLFVDDFSNPASGFDHFMMPEGIMDYDAGGYRILVNAPQTNFWATPRKNFRDVSMEVDVGKLGGPDENRIGLLCRFSSNNYYFFLITSDGFYGVGIYFDGQAILLGQNELLPSDAIKKGLAVNRMRADCAGDRLVFYVNNVQLANVQHDVLPPGDIGLLAGAFDQTGVDVIFDNFLVLKP